MGKWVHRILEVTREGPWEGRGTCANCGSVRLIKKDNRWKCSVAKEQQRGSRGNTPAYQYRRGTHGLTVREASELKQDAHCAICSGTDRLVIDHCHFSNKVRGVLCNKCNVGLGMFQDETYLLKAAIDYLENNS